MLPINRCAPALPALCLPGTGCCAAACCPKGCPECALLPAHPPPAPQGPDPRSSPLQRGDAAGVLGLAAGDSVRHPGSVAQPPRCFVLLLGSGRKKLVSLRVGGVILPAPVHAVRAGWGQQAHPRRARTESTLRQHQGVCLLLWEASVTEKAISPPFVPLSRFSQFFSGHLKLLSHCSYFYCGDHGVGVSKSLLASQQALNVSVRYSA